jgi:hypothetical protein
MLTIETRKYRTAVLIDRNKDVMKEDGGCCTGSDVMVSR